MPFGFFDILLILIALGVLFGIFRLTRIASSIAPSRRASDERSKDSPGERDPELPDGTK